MASVRMQRVRRKDGRKKTSVATAIFHKHVKSWIRKLDKLGPDSLAWVTVVNKHGVKQFTCNGCGSRFFQDKTAHPHALTRQCASCFVEEQVAYITSRRVRRF